MKAICYYEPQSPRSSAIAEAMATGIRKTGDTAQVSSQWSREVAADVVVAYGWGHPDVFDAYWKAGKSYVYVDLGWWHRKPQGRVMEGYHKVVVNGREPGDYFRRGFPAKRLAPMGVTVAPWRQAGSHVLLAGMSGKSARTRGFKPQEWERRTVAEIRRHTSRPIIYRPKPSWADAWPIEGTIFSPAAEPLAGVLRNCWAVVTLHSNVAVDALAAGIPARSEEGVAAEFSWPIEEIESPPLKDGRGDLLADIAWCQWSVAEMRSGECWAHLKAETPLCG